MKRLQDRKIDDAAYYEIIWGKDIAAGRSKFDPVRQLALAEKVKSGDKVVDLGAGVYGTAEFIAEHIRTKCILVAYDQSYTAKEIVDQKNLPLLYLLGLVPDTIFPSKTFDVVIAGEVIEHMEDPKDLVHEMARICKPGGWMVISTVDTTCEQAIAHGPYPEHIWEFTKEDLIGLFKRYGETEYRLVGNYHVIYCKRN